MRSDIERSFYQRYALIAGVVAAAMLAQGILACFWDRIGPHWQAAMIICSVLTLGAFLWLNILWIRTIQGICEIFKFGDSHDNWKIGNTKGFAGTICKTLQKQLDKYAAEKRSLEEQLKDLQLMMQLSKRQTKNTEAIIYSISDAVIVIDEFDKLVMANEAAGSLFGFNFKTSQFKPIADLLKTDRSGFIDHIKDSRDAKARHTRHEMEFNSGGEKKTFDCIISCVTESNKSVSGVVAILHDITREKEISQMKNDFVSHVSHELRTPLASITAYSEMLANGEAHDEQTRKEFYSIIQTQAQRLNRMIEDILNTARIESGLIKVSNIPVSLTILIEEQLKMMRSYAAEKNITIIGQQPIVFDQVLADKDMISQVIVNLLSNAVKYTPAGGTVKVDTQMDDNAGVIRVSVTDTGVGIPESDMKHLFEKFYRVEANKKQAKGTGLGLNLVKQIIEKVHNGRVFVKSQVGVGSTFGFELPLASARVAVTA